MLDGLAGVDGWAGPAPVRVLVSDDQAVVRAGYVTILAAQPGIEVVGEAGNGSVAVAEAQRLRPDVVVMDVQMPVLDGIEATRRLAGPSVAAPVKVLVVTNFNLDEAGLSQLLRQRFGPKSDAILAAYRQENSRQSPFLVQAAARP